MKQKESWQRFSDDTVRGFLSVGHEGTLHPSRIKAVHLLEGMRSVLDVGCGTGVMFDLIRERRPDLDYLGIDTTEKFIHEARRKYPGHADRFRHGSLYELNTLDRTFDAVLCRHVLEHLPDYIPAVQYLYDRAAHKLIIVFYLPPRPLLSGRRRDEKFQKGFYTHTYDLGQLMDHILNGLVPLPEEIRVHPRQGTSDPACPWGDRENIIYEIIRAVSDAPASPG